MLLFVYSYNVFAAEGAEDSKNSQVQHAPDFTLKSLKGSNLKLSEFRGDVVVINFWASWCGPCRQEMPALNDLYLKHRDQGLTLLGVNVEKNASKAANMIRDLRVVYPVLFDSNGEVSKLYKVEDMPSTVFVDRDGNIRYLHNYASGAEDEYVRHVRELMAE
ncbi:MAG: redoxin [Gammaproteobacteria bacterium SG8_11]|nr:MAG: redoxin [Gammaproteobacteria bacterium SG8_11]